MVGGMLNTCGRMVKNCGGDGNRQAQQRTDAKEAANNHTHHERKESL